MGGEGGFEEWAGAVGFLAGVIDGLLPCGDGDFVGGEGCAEVDDGLGEGGGAFGAEAGFAWGLDGDGEDGEAEGAEGAESGCGDVAGGGVAGGGAAGDVDEEAAVLEEGGEFLAGDLRGGIGGGEHGAAAGAFEVGAGLGVVDGGFFDEPGDFPA